MASSPVPPPDKRPAFCSPVLLIVITCIIIASIALFIVLRPNPSGKGQQSPTATPAASR
ncbi:hypothetical protein RBB76_03310 [Tunturiibacter psychrotolerans]|uniref:hypothetical protein n=1 Tax=Tunturiibacter psychrotolerans TaxID=3069686 RepID=UPI003D9B8388